ncbi:MAG: cytochrome c3 family protein [Thermodesulfobacteriota bacterium]
MTTRFFPRWCMKAPVFLGMLLVILICPLETARASSWLIDARKFHASVHGRASCQDCHGGLQGQPLHPDPENVTKKREAFFHVDHCLACHDDVLDNLAKGVHGTGKVDHPENYRACLSCHDPHYQIPVKDDVSGKLDPSKPRHEQCGLCHKDQTALPALSGQDEQCMTCHRLAGPGEPKAVQRMGEFCLHCHAAGQGPAQKQTAKKISPINRDIYGSTPHAKTECTVCHSGAAQFNHGEQKLGECSECHLPHDEKVAHDAHVNVDCEACHLGGVQVVRDEGSKKVTWKRVLTPGKESRVHHMVLPKGEGSCKRCHSKGNPVGAAALVLPAKSILCMPCHTATFSVGDTTTILALVVFLAGTFLFLFYVLTGTGRGTAEKGTIGKFVGMLGDGIKGLFSAQIVPVLKALFLDVLCQRRLYRRSPSRWAIHGLIFYPFVFRSLWGILALAGSLWTPGSAWIWAMLDKNHGLTGFLFDLTGLMLILGTILAYLRGARAEKNKPAKVPGRDRIALILIGGIVVVGFVVEGMRIAMTGSPEGSGHAFAGYGLSLLFGLLPSALTGLYGYVWYLHGFLTGAFVAYLPFSRLLHVILAPVVLAIGAASEGKHHPHLAATDPAPDPGR